MPLSTPETIITLRSLFTCLSRSRVMIPFIFGIWISRTTHPILSWCSPKRVSASIPLWAFNTGWPIDCIIDSRIVRKISSSSTINIVDRSVIEYCLAKKTFCYIRKCCLRLYNCAPSKKLNWLGNLAFSQ